MWYHVLFSFSCSRPIRLRYTYVHTCRRRFIFHLCLDVDKVFSTDPPIQPPTHSHLPPPPPNDYCCTICHLSCFPFFFCATPPPPARPVPGHGENGEHVAAYTMREVPRRLELHVDAVRDPARWELLFGSLALFASFYYIIKGR